MAPRWSPDGRRLRFTLHGPKDHSEALWEISADGTGLHPLLPGWSNPPAECCGDWTPDGRYYFFPSLRNKLNTIWAIRERRDLRARRKSAPVQISTAPSDLSSPVFSQHGSKLLVLRKKAHGETIRFDTKSRQVAPFLSGLSAQSISFSNDGRWISYVTFPEGLLWRSRVDGSAALQLTSPPMRAAWPSWSPDGRTIAFVGGLPENSKIYTVQSNGSEIHLVAPSAETQSHPSWSPDGATIAFAREGSDPADPAMPRTIHLFRIADKNVTDLPESGGLYAPYWSANGAYIAGLTTDSRVVKVFSMVSRKWTEVAKGLEIKSLFWAHDSKSIFFQDAGERQRPMFRAWVDTNRTGRIVTGTELRRPGVVYNTLTGLTPVHSPLLISIRSSSDIYALDLQLP